MKFLLFIVVGFMSFPLLADHSPGHTLPPDLLKAKQETIKIMQDFIRDEYKRINGEESRYKLKADGIDMLYKMGYQSEAEGITEEAMELYDANSTQEFFENKNIYFRLLVPGGIFENLTCCIVCC